MLNSLIDTDISRWIEVIILVRFFLSSEEGDIGEHSREIVLKSHAVRPLSTIKVTFRGFSCVISLPAGYSAQSLPPFGFLSKRIPNNRVIEPKIKCDFIFSVREDFGFGLLVVSRWRSLHFSFREVCLRQHLLRETVAPEASIFRTEKMNVRPECRR